MRALAGVIIGGLVLAACGGDGADDSTGESNAFAAALAETFKTQEALTLDDDEIDCLAIELIDAIGGPAALSEAGISPEDITATEGVSELDLDVTEAQAQEIAGSFAACDISVRGLVMEGIGDEYPAEVRDCIADALGDDTITDVFVQAILEGGDAGDYFPDDVLGEMFACLDA